jgi:glycosyltransferase involved in cell wall biosynthesis
MTATILNGVDLRKFSPRDENDGETAALKSALGIPQERKVVGIVGRIVREKGYREFFKMAQGVLRTGLDAAFLVVGDSLPSDRDHFGPTFRASIREAGLNDRFVLVGNVSDVPRYLRVMDIFVLPSYREGLPRSILEAMATRLPVVATNIRGCREAVLHEETGLIVPPTDSHSLERAVRYLLTNPDVAKQMGYAGRKRACGLFDEDRVKYKFVSAIQNLHSL